MFIPTIFLIIIFLLFVYFFKQTADAFEWLNFKINVIERLIYEKNVEINRKDIENAVDSVLANDYRYKKIIKMLKKFSKYGTFRHKMEIRIFDGDLSTVDIFKDVDLKQALIRFEEKFRNLKWFSFS